MAKKSKLRKSKSSKSKPRKAKSAPRKTATRPQRKVMTKKVKPKKKTKLSKKRHFRYHTPLAKKPPTTPKHLRFKTARHPKDGLGIEFKIPTGWKETWGSEDNALFYPAIPELPGPSPMGGRLFVRFRFETVGHANDGAAFGLLMAHRTDESQTVIQLDSGPFMLHFQSRHHTDGFNAVDYYWILAQPFPPRRVAIASFLFSGVAELFDGPKAPEAHIVSILEKTIPKAVFDREILPVHKEPLVEG